MDMAIRIGNVNLLFVSEELTNIVDCHPSVDVVCYNKLCLKAFLYS